MDLATSQKVIKGLSRDSNSKLDNGSKRWLISKDIKQYINSDIKRATGKEGFSKDDMLEMLFKIVIDLETRLKVLEK